MTSNAMPKAIRILTQLPEGSFATGECGSVVPAGVIVSPQVGA